jgi:proline-specific peptidase
MYEALQQHEAAADFENPEYQAAVMQFYKQHLCRLSPWPDCLMRSVANLDGNPVYLTMNVPNEFTVVGNLKDWDRRDRLQDIRVPALITVGRYDEIPLPCAETLHRGIPGSKLVVFDQSSHMAMLEQSDAFVEGVAAFLSQAEETSRGPTPNSAMEPAARSD